MSETRTCQNCKNDFTIEPEDFVFYEKMNVPPPTFCPACRLVRRLAWFKGFRLYKRACDLCKKEKISMYRPDAPYTIYCNECWWSDAWDPGDHAREYDFSKSFFTQFDELLHRVPIRGLAIDAVAGELSPYTNHCGFSKGCYLIFYSEYCEDTEYGFYLSKNKSLIDCSVIWESEYCYDSMNGFRNYQVHGSRGNVHNSNDCYFIKDSKNAEQCFGSANLYNKKFVFFNEQLSEEEYNKKMSAIDLGSYKTYREMKTRSEEVWKKSIPYPYYDYYSENSTGNYVFHSKNCKECYDSGYCEDSKYVLLIKVPTVKDSYDYTDWGEGAERIYEGITVGGGVMDVRFGQDIHQCHSIDYSKSCMGSSNLFGCVSMRNKDYCILNKQYSREGFEDMRKKIIEHMMSQPYTDHTGNTYRYGEFFPPELSPHEYNDTFAHMFRPLTRDAALAAGLTWVDDLTGGYATTKHTDELPDHIRDAGDMIINDTIQCAACPRGYRISKHEFQFLRKHNFPLPRKCPFCRIEEKIKRWVWQMTLGERVCDKCGKQFRTNYRKEDASIVYCKECYVKEIL